MRRQHNRRCTSHTDGSDELRVHGVRAHPPPVHERVRQAPIHQQRDDESRVDIRHHARRHIFPKCACINQRCIQTRLQNELLCIRKQMDGRQVEKQESQEQAMLVLVLIPS